MLGILTTHPIQYQTPIWRRLAARGNVPFRVLFMSRQGILERTDPGFRRALAWDIDLLSGYPNEFVEAIEGTRQDSFWWLRLPRNFISDLKSTGVTTLWIQGWQVAAYWQAVWGAQNIGIETWLRAETNLRSRGGGRLAPVKDLLLQQFLKRVDQFLYIGEANRRFYLAKGVDPRRLISAPYCVDNERFRAQADAARPNRAELRANWGIPSDAFCILFVGKFVPKKRPLDVIEACRILTGRKDCPVVHLLFVGTGELIDVVRANAWVVHDFVGFPGAERVEGPRVSLAGFLNQSEISNAYAAADLLVLPSDAGETWGLVVNEAMASGLPAVVSADAGCSDDLVMPTRPDLVFATGRVDALADSIMSAMRSPPLARDLEQIIDRYHIDRTVEAVETLYAASARARERLPVEPLR